jgi:hypothetical protein
MANNNTYKVKFSADVQQFDSQCQKAASSYKKFTGSIDADSRVVTLGFSGIVK